MFDQTWAMPIKLQQFVCCKFGIVELISIYVCACVSFTLNFHSWTCKHWTKLTTDRSMIVANLIDFYWCIISKSCVCMVFQVACKIWLRFLSHPIDNRMTNHFENCSWLFNESTFKLCKVLGWCGWWKGNFSFKRQTEFSKLNALLMNYSRFNGI